MLPGSVICHTACALRCTHTTACKLRCIDADLYAVFNMEGDNEDNGEDDEDLSLSDNEHTLAFEDEVEDDPNDVGASVGVGRRGGTLTTTGSFVLTSAANRAGNDEEE